QEIDRVGADRADRVAVALPRQGEPADRIAARNLGEDLGGASNALPLLVALEPADILVPEPVRGDLVTLTDQRADEIAMDMRDDRWDREGGADRVPAKNLAQRCETLIGAEQRLRRGEVGGGNALRRRSDAQVDGDRDAAAGAVRPADLGFGEAPL